MKTKLINSIISLSIQSSHGNIADYALYSHLGVNPVDVALDLNALYKDKMIDVREVNGRFKVIFPTPLAIKLNPHVRPVSQKDCMLVFKTIWDISDMNKQYGNASYRDVTGKCANRVGVITLDNALSKLVQAGFVSVNKPTDRMTTYTVTKVGVSRYNAQLTNPTKVTSPPAPARTKYVRKERSVEDSIQQSVLRNLAFHVGVVKSYERKAKRNPAIVSDQVMVSAYEYSLVESHLLRSQLNFGR